MKISAVKVKGLLTSEMSMLDLRTMLLQYRSLCQVMRLLPCFVQVPDRQYRDISQHQLTFSPSGVTVYSALRRCGAESGNWVVLLGAGGGLGHIATQLASRGMAYRVIGIDSGSKKDLVMKCGAEAFVDFEKSNPEEEVKKLTGGLGAQAVLVLTASNGAYGMAMPLLRFGGTIVCVGIPEGDFKPISTAFPAHLITKAATIRGVAVGDRKEAIETLDFAARGVIKTHFRTEKMDALTKVFEQMERAELQGRVVLDLS